MQKQGLSLRYKLLIALTALPLVALSLFLVLAIRIFEKDKIVYVFDSSLSVSKTKASRVRSEIGSLISTTQSLILTFVPESKTLGPTGQYFFEHEGKIESFLLFQPQPDGHYERVLDLQKDAAKTTVAAEEASIQSMLQTATQAQSLILRKPAGRPKSVWLALKFADADPKKSMIAVTMFSDPDLSETFEETGPYMSFLAHASGDVLFNPVITDKTGAIWEPSEIWKLLAVKAGAGPDASSDGTAEIKSPTKNPYLASFVRLGVDDLVVVSVVDKGAALQAVGTLLHKSIAFFISLLAITMLISVFASRGLTSALGNLLYATQKVAEGDFDFRVNLSSTDEFGTLANSFNVMAEEVSRLVKETAEKARMESELATAKTVQETLFPEANAELGSVQISGHYMPASECGGDWWFHCEIGNRVYIWIGDATGHGAPAALLTSAARAVASVIQMAPPMQPADSIALLNRAIYDTSKGNMMMTFFLASIDNATGQMYYVNASHEAPYILKGGIENPTREDYIALNEVNNPRLGEGRDIEFNQGSTILEPGDRLIFYTDGVIDVKNPEAKVWGERRFLKALSHSLAGHATTQDSVSGVVENLAEYRKSTPLDDDVTLVICKFKGAV
jgi:sigma-B regulation protein RsbU (phosphoserine phosphatase)